MSAGLDCQELVELVTAYLDGALSGADKARFEQHLGLCKGCAHYVDQFRTTIRLLGELPVESISPAVQSALLEAFRGWRTA